jgi:ribosomal protein S18 acetylase RimI-like enzyme
MAAAIDPASRASFAELVDLRELRSPDLADLLQEEIETWRTGLDWDFRASADLVRRFLDQRSLSGYALVTHGRVFGYGYYVHDEHKGLIGDLYVRRSYAAAEHERHLLGTIVEQLMRSPFVNRIETQLMLAGENLEPLPGSRFLKSFDRKFMRIGLERVGLLPRGSAADRVHIANWQDWHQESAAYLIPEAYRGHIDSRINDQYDTVSGARRFLYNIVQYPGCGAFFRPASYIALDRDTGVLTGVSLTSMVAPDIGHITQICVAPNWRDTGLGYELLRRSLVGLSTAGCRSATLTVTASNRDAIRLYDRIGFETIRNFRAFVWEGF